MARGKRKPYDGKATMLRVHQNLGRASRKMQPGKLRDYVDNNRANIAIAVSEFGALIDAINRNEDARNNQESKSLK